CEDELSRNERAAEVLRTISVLDPRECQVLAWYFFDELQLKEIGTRLGITESRVSQIVTSATKKMRLAFGMVEQDRAEVTPLLGKRRRRHSRHRQESLVLVRTPSGTRVGFLRDVSAGGAAVMMDTPPEMGSQLHLRFAVSGRSRLVERKATVRWSRASM